MLRVNNCMLQRCVLVLRSDSVTGDPDPIQICARHGPDRRRFRSKATSFHVSVYFSFGYFSHAFYYVIPCDHFIYFQLTAFHVYLFSC